jgi:hypothetical protein
MVNLNTRSVPAWYRRQIIREQDGKCANPKCLKTEINWKESETNHIIPWKSGGRTIRWNLEVLCITCHKNKTRSLLQKPRKKIKDEISYEKPRKSYRFV